MSIQGLIAPLGISTKTLYKYFKNKEELLEEVLRLHFDQKYKLLENLAEDQNSVTLLFDIWYLAIENSCNVNNLFYKDLHHYYPDLEQKNELAVGAKFGMQFKRLIRKGMIEGVFIQEIVPEIVMEGIYVLFNSVARTELFQKFEVTPYQTLLNTITLYIRGLCTLKGIRDLEAHLSTVSPFEF